MGADIQGIYTVSDTRYSCRESSISQGYTLYYTPAYTGADSGTRFMLPSDGISVYDYDGIPAFDVITLKTDQGLYVYRVPKDEYWANIPETHQLFTLEEYIYHLEFEHRFLNLILQPSASPPAENTPEATPEPSPSPERTPRTPRPERTSGKTAAYSSAYAPQASLSNSRVLPPSAAVTLLPSPGNDKNQFSLPIMAIIAVLSLAAAGSAVYLACRHIKNKKG